MDSSEIRQKYLDFFKSKNHKVIASSSLIPENDPTVLFTTAGMHPLVPYLMGEKHPEGRRLVNFQKCIRTGDIDEVGDDTHLTFFEMLGNWSLGDSKASDGIGMGYWKNDAITWSFDFLTKELGIPVDRLAVSCFKGDKDVGKDKESAIIWEALGIPKERVAFLGKKDNWWGPAGDTGPCGPDTEMFFYVGKKVPKKFDPKDEKWVEIWNDVFMEYDKQLKVEGRKLKAGESLRDDDFEYVKLKQKNVDTGMGLERITAVLNEKENVFETDIFEAIIAKIKELAGLERKTIRSEKTRAIRIIADHIRATTFIIGDKKGIAPSNTDQGYVLRRLIRRAIRYGKQIDMPENFTDDVASVVIDTMKDAYPELEENRDFIITNIVREENKFNRTLENGLREFEKISKDKKKIGGEESFLLFQSYGFPYEMTKELAKEKNIRIDREDFDKEYKKHQKLSRTASAGKFKGGLADNGEIATRYHTATHLLLAALKKVLQKNDIEQRGSNINAERLRFDFNYPEKLTDGQKKMVEDFVNDSIEKKIPVEMMEMSLDRAKDIGATGTFGSKYGEKVKVYKVGDISMEICGGPHVGSTGDLGHFRIKKEQSSSAGVRRIKAVLE